jgi:anti-sigma B factor antagonist
MDSIDVLLPWVVSGCTGSETSALPATGYRLPQAHIVFFIATIDLIHKRQPLSRSGRETMNVNIRTVGDVRIVDLNGKITLGEETVTLRTTVRNLVNDGNKKIVLNLADVNYIDSSGVGELVSTYTTVTNAGGRLKLLQLTKKIQQLLAITKLLTVFDVFDNEKAAIASFQ